MPARRKHERVLSRFFPWVLGRRNGVYFADGRSGGINLGRHSLGTRDRAEARRALDRLDAVKAVEHGRAPRSVLEETSTEELVTLEEGRELYLKHVNRPAVVGGAGGTTAKRYRAVLDKFVTFAREQGVSHWQAVSKQLAEAYAAWLDDKGYKYATEYLELTVLKQVVKHLVREHNLPASCLLELPLRKPRGTSTYCYTRAEVAAMLEHCAAMPGLEWLGRVIVALIHTGLRIGELAELRWVDLDEELALLRLTDSRYRGNRQQQAERRMLKSHRDRSLPVHGELRKVLAAMARQPDGRVFHGPFGGRLKPDTVRNDLSVTC
jgi:site-specific recombinase XerC